MTGGVYRSAQQHNGCSKGNCLKTDDLAQQDCNNIATCVERGGYENLWSFSQGPTDRNTTATHKRSECKDAVANFSRSTEGSCRQRPNCNPKHSWTRSCTPTRWSNVVSTGNLGAITLIQPHSEQESPHQESHQSRFSSAKHGADAWTNGSNWWSSGSSSHCWHRL